MDNLDYRGLAALEALAASGSVEKAALALGISQSAVSQRVKVLEDATGRLLVVHGAPSVPTGLGQRLVVHYRNVKLMEASLDIELGQPVSMPDISLAIDAGSLATWFPEALPPLLAAPRCQLDVQLADTELALHLVREGSVFGCVVAGQHDCAPGTSVSALGRMAYLCVATPAFAAHWFGDGISEAALKLAPAVVGRPNLLARYLEASRGFRGAFPRHQLPSLPALHACITGGMAYGLMPAALARPLLACDELVELDPGSKLDLSLHWHAWHLDTPFTRALSEQIIETARRRLVQA